MNHLFLKEIDYSSLRAFWVFIQEKYGSHFRTILIVKSLSEEKQ